MKGRRILTTVDVWLVQVSDESASQTADEIAKEWCDQVQVESLYVRDTDGPSLPDDDLDLSAPLSDFQVKPRTYCKSWMPSGFQTFHERPAYDDAFPGGFEPGDALMPFCRTCARGYLEKPELTEQAA